MQHSVIEIVETLCREFGENGICGVGVTAALRAMSAYWTGHLAEGNREEIICTDIREVGKLLQQMRVEILQRMQQQKQSVGQPA